MNEHDSERIGALLEGEGLERAAAPDDADVLVYNTCTIRKNADNRLAGHLGTAARLKSEDRGRLVVVAGCLPQAEQADFFARFPFVDVPVGPQSLHELPDLLARGGGAGRRGPAASSRTGRASAAACPHAASARSRPGCRS